MRTVRRRPSTLVLTLWAVTASVVPEMDPLHGQPLRAGEEHYDQLFVNGFSWGLDGIEEVPVLNTTPPWERVWDTRHTFFPRIRLGDADGTVWEVVLNPHAVQAIVVAQDRRTLEARLEALWGDNFTPVWLNLLDFVRTAQVEIRGFLPENPGDLDHETWTENVRSFVRYPPFSEPIEVEGDSIAPDYLLGNIWQGVVELSRSRGIEGYWIDYLVKVAHSVYKVEGHNPPDEHCIKLDNCMLFCDRTRGF